VAVVAALRVGLLLMLMIWTGAINSCCWCGSSPGDHPCKQQASTLVDVCTCLERNDWVVLMLFEDGPLCTTPLSIALNNAMSVCKLRQQHKQFKALTWLLALPAARPGHHMLMRQDAST
jgi:hypothetical protein